jgi:hypothetical protein
LEAMVMLFQSHVAGGCRQVFFGPTLMHWEQLWEPNLARPPRLDATNRPFNTAETPELDGQVVEIRWNRHPSAHNPEVAGFHACRQRQRHAFPLVCTGFGDNVAGRVHAAPRNGVVGMVARRRHRWLSTDDERRSPKSGDWRCIAG